VIITLDDDYWSSSYSACELNTRVYPYSTLDFHKVATEQNCSIVVASIAVVSHYIVLSRHRLRPLVPKKTNLLTLRFHTISEPMLHTVTDSAFFCTSEQHRGGYGLVSHYPCIIILVK